MWEGETARSDDPSIEEKGIVRGVFVRKAELNDAYISKFPADVNEMVSREEL
jgi:hypothetical protein